MAQSPTMAERLGLGMPRVLYAQTDSIFVLLPEKSAAEASILGKKLAAAITDEIGELPVKLNYESCVVNFILQAVNRYAAKSLDGSLLAKGVETDRRVMTVRFVFSLVAVTAPMREHLCGLVFVCARVCVCVVRRSCSEMVCRILREGIFCLHSDCSPALIAAFSRHRASAPNLKLTAVGPNVLVRMCLESCGA